MRLRLGKVTVADVLAAQPVTTNLLKFMRASIKMIGVSNLQSFIASMTQKLTLSDISDESKKYLFFFQAEDGIRDHCVTGVQTCALPISRQQPGGRGRLPPEGQAAAGLCAAGRGPGTGPAVVALAGPPGLRGRLATVHFRGAHKIGRASCRERV